MSHPSLEKRVDERRKCRTLCQYQQDTKKHERDNDGGQPILLVLFHELPEFAYYLCFRHFLTPKTFSHNGVDFSAGLSKAANKNRSGLLDDAADPSQTGV